MKLIRSLVLSLVVVAALVSPVAAAVSSESAALAVLASDAGLPEKARACQELGDLGGPKSVAPLAALLNKEHLADYARSGLEGIKDPSAGVALRKALPTLEGRFLAGAVNSLASGAKSRRCPTSRNWPSMRNAAWPQRRLLLSG